MVILLHQLLAEAVADGIVGFNHERDSPLLVEVDDVVLDVAVNPIHQTLHSLRMTSSRLPYPFKRWKVAQVFHRHHKIVVRPHVLHNPQKALQKHIFDVVPCSLE